MLSFHLSMFNEKFLIKQNLIAHDDFSLLTVVGVRLVRFQDEKPGFPLVMAVNTNTS